MSANPAISAISAFRAFGGASFWIAPDLTARARRSGPVARDRLSARLAGAREVALALGALRPHATARLCFVTYVASVTLTGAALRSSNRGR